MNTLRWNQFVVLLSLFCSGWNGAWEPVHYADAAEPAAIEFNATGGAAASGWIMTHDRPTQAIVTFDGALARIQDQEPDGQPEDAYFRHELNTAQRNLARSVGFVYEWTLRIPNDTNGVTRAISTEVWIADERPSSQLRFGLQFGRRGAELMASVHTGSDGTIEAARRLENADAFHDWKLIFDGPTQVLNLLLDGQLLIKARIDHLDQGHDLVFGSRATGEGTSEWKRVRFSPGTSGHQLVQPLPAETPRFFILAQERASIPTPIDVFTSGTDGYFAYRIPALIVAPNRDLLVFCEARKRDLQDDGDIDLVMKRSSNGGRTWSAQQLIYEEGGAALIKYGNPTAVVDEQTGTIWLAVNRDYLTDQGQRAGGQLILFRSDDSGQSWSAPIDITNSVRQSNWGHHAFGPGIGIQLRLGPHQGRLLFPANFRKSFDKRQPSYAHVIFSDDHGKTWKLGGVLGDYTNECQLAEIVDRDRPGLLINMRNHWGRGGEPRKSGSRLVARSFDGGLSWDAETIDPALPEPPCQASLLRYSFGSTEEPSRLLFANPIGPGRMHLRIRLSLDEGKTWPQGKLIYAGEAAYSCMVRLPMNQVGIVYERDRYKNISFCAISLERSKGSGLFGF